MKLSVLKYPFVVIHALLTLLLGYFFINLHFGEFHLITNLDSYSTHILFITTIIHLVAAFVGSLALLRLPEDSRNETDRILLPIFYFAFSLSNIFGLAFSPKAVLSFSIIGKTYIFSISFAFFILLLFGLFHIGINKVKLFSFTSIAFLGAILLANIIPHSISLNINQRVMWFPKLSFPIFIGVLTVLSLINFIELYLRDTSRHNLIKLISMATIAIGSFLYVLRPNIYLLWASVVLFSVGVILSIPRNTYTTLY